MIRILNSINCCSAERLEAYSGCRSKRYAVEDKIGKRFFLSESLARLLRRVGFDRITVEISPDRTMPRRFRLLDVGRNSGNFLSARSRDAGLSLIGSGVDLTGLPVGCFFPVIVEKIPPVSLTQVNMVRQ